MYDKYCYVIVMVIACVDVWNTELEPYMSPNCNSKAKRDLSENGMNYTREQEMFKEFAPDQMAYAKHS